VPQAKVAFQLWHPVGELEEGHDVDDGLVNVKVEPCGGHGAESISFRLTTDNTCVVSLGGVDLPILNFPR
jgi:glyoxylase-like metal-dependent hydrolase (beta-lactamase superfamily II)